MPFDKGQINKYINRQFPILAFYGLPNRRKAKSLVERVPELSVRPMLLELLPDLVRERREVSEIFELYRFMIEQWLIRESHWIPKDILYISSKKLAVHIFEKQSNGHGDRVSVNELMAVATTKNVDVKYWDHLTSRSLLNRDGDGGFKFAHRSILEYFFVVAAIEGEEKCFSLKWTDLMKELFISWGYVSIDQDSVEVAESILKRDLNKTGLIPLSAPPNPPARISGTILDRTFKSKTARGIRHKTISPTWRGNSLFLNERGSNWRIWDVEYNLEWVIPREVNQDDELNEFAVMSLVDLQKLENNERDPYRFPSYEEFISLIQGLEAIDRMDILSSRHPYYIGDKLGDRMHLVVSLDGALASTAAMAVIDENRIIDGLGVRPTLYMASIHHNPAVFQSAKAIGARVRRPKAK
ncbi:hypothetical protein HFP57_13605 [Parasphingopyxis algicola]|uniref:hypothetical protein n=1 Tax=Parasphingopyxis algicola TaxID=2026624 RepID=UPI0015A0F0FB|nr:hypothetical protein [Parasphingopyxis algicola]QLC25957.1 hypothetical protein HFP57_13605 [Parasphingopyxis algicola]